MVFVGAVLATVIELSSMVIGMAAGDHFQAFSVPVTWQSNGLEPPDAIEEEVAVRSIGLPVEGTVSVDGGSVASAEAMARLAVCVPAAGLVLLVIASTLRHVAAIEHEHSLTI